MRSVAYTGPPSAGLRLWAVKKAGLPLWILSWQELRLPDKGKMLVSPADMSARAAPHLKKCAQSLSAAAHSRLATLDLRCRMRLDDWDYELPNDHSSPNERPGRADGT